MKKNGMPVPPSEILNEGILKPVGMTANALATAIRVPANRITEFQRDERANCSRCRCSQVLDGQHKRGFDRSAFANSSEGSRELPGKEICGAQSRLGPALALLTKK